MRISRKYKEMLLLCLIIVAMLFSCGKLQSDKVVKRGSSDGTVLPDGEVEVEKSSGLVAVSSKLGIDLSLTTNDALKENLLLLSPSFGGATLYGSEGQAWRFSDESKRWQALDQITGFEGKIFNVDDQTVWLLTNESISVTSFDNLKSGKNIATSFVPKDYKLVGLSKSGAVFVPNDSKIEKIIWLRQNSNITFTEYTLPWAKENGLVLTASASDDGSSFFAASKNIIELYSIQGKKVLLSNSFRLNLNGISGSPQSMRLSCTFEGKKPIVELAQVLTDQGLYSSLYAAPDDEGVGGGNPALSWSENIRPLAVDFCKKCHYVESGRALEKGDNEDSWKEKKQAIIQQITSRSMPPSNDVTGNTITDLQRAKFLDWLNSQP